MLEILDTLVSLDLFKVFFCCDLEKCHGACCIEGDAGAPSRWKKWNSLKKLTRCCTMTLRQKLSNKSRMKEWSIPIRRANWLPKSFMARTVLSSKTMEHALSVPSMPLTVADASTGRNLSPAPSTPYASPKWVV